MNFCAPKTPQSSNLQIIVHYQLSIVNYQLSIDLLLATNRNLLRFVAYFHDVNAV